MAQENKPVEGIHRIKILTHPLFQRIKNLTLSDSDIPDRISFLFIGAVLTTGTIKSSSTPYSIDWSDMKEHILKISKDKELDWISLFEKENNLRETSTFYISSIFANYFVEEIE